MCHEHSRTKTVHPRRYGPAGTRYPAPESGDGQGTGNDGAAFDIEIERSFWMTTVKTFSNAARAAAAGLILALGHAAGAPAHAADSMWGGEAEWGGKRQMVTFNPQYQKGQIIVSFGDRRLYHVVASGQAMSYPIAVPREKARWEGVASITQKRENPSWTPTPEMIHDNPRLPSWVPGGHPMNPLGVRAMYLGSSTYRIHGTDAPWTIGTAASAGCIRMYNEDVLDLYPRVPVGTRVTVTWQRFNTAPSSFAAVEDKASKPAKGEKPVKVSEKAEKTSKETAPAVVSFAEAEKQGKPAATKATYAPAAGAPSYDDAVTADMTDEEARAARRKAILAKYMANRKARSGNQQSSDASPAKPQKNAAVE